MRDRGTEDTRDSRRARRDNGAVHRRDLLRLLGAASFAPLAPDTGPAALPTQAPSAVLPGETVRTQVTISTHPGLYLYHSHILEHEDMGMMRNFRIRA